MSEIVITVARYGFLVLLWIFVFTVVGVIRRDLFVGARSSRLVATPRGLGGITSGRPAKVKRGRAAHNLVVTEGALAGTRLTLGESQITIGRAEDSTLVITDDYASARHARLVPRAGQWFVEDLGSTNGTYLDRAKVTAPTPVPLGVPTGSAARPSRETRNSRCATGAQDRGLSGTEKGSDAGPRLPAWPRHGRYGRGDVDSNLIAALATDEDGRQRAGRHAPQGAWSRRTSGSATPSREPAWRLGDDGTCCCQRHQSSAWSTSGTRALSAPRGECAPPRRTVRECWSTRADPAEEANNHPATVLLCGTGRPRRRPEYSVPRGRFAETGT